MKANETITYRNFTIEFIGSELAVKVKKDGFVLNKFMSLGGRGWKNQAKKIVDNWYAIQ